MKRKLSLFLSMMVLAIAMVFSTTTFVNAAEYDEEKARATAEAAFEQYWEGEAVDYSMTEEEKEELISYYGEEGLKTFFDFAELWNTTREDTGAFKEITDVEIAEDSDDETIIRVTLIVDYEKQDLKFTVPVKARDYSLAATDYTDISVELIVPMSQVMKEAGLNTLMGVGLVFAVLILIIIVISGFSIIGKIENRKKEKEAAAAPAAPAPVAAPVVEEVTEDVTDDCELVAVITAAIMASMAESGEVPADGLVVRSIRRRKW